MRATRVQVREAGHKDNPAFTLIIPRHIVQAIVGEDVPKDDLVEAFKGQYEFEPELTPEGILYRAFKKNIQPGW